MLRKSLLDQTKVRRHIGGPSGKALGRCGLVAAPFLSVEVGDLPIVTLRGDVMRGRHSAAMLDMMGMTARLPVY